MKYFKYSFTLLLLLCGVYMSWAQSEFPRPCAHYPLESYVKNPTVSYQKFTLVRPWDVSGNARHGTITGEQYFEQGKWIGEAVNNQLAEKARPCIHKSDSNYDKDAHISIPDPFGDYNINNGGFALSFWYHRDGINNKEDQIIFNDKFQIAITGNTTKFRHYTGTKTEEITFQPSGSTSIDVGWFFFALTWDQENDTLFHYYEHYGSNLGPDIDLMELIAEDISYHKQYFSNTLNDFPSAQKKNQISSDHFDGMLSNVRFYDQYMTYAKINEIKTIDAMWALRHHHDESYLEQGMFMDFQFSNGAMTESRNGLNATNHGSVVTQDRFGNNEAINLDGGTNKYVATPSFFKSTTPPINYDPSVGGVTFSFWVKTDSQQEFPSDPTELQDLYNNFGGTTKKMFYANDASNRELFGMQRFKGALGQIRYTHNASSQLQSWFFWLYDRVAFARQANVWYHVVFVQHPNWQRMYVAAKDKEINCECEETDIACWEACRCAYNYQGIQNLSAATKFGIGNDQGKAIANIDDFRVYHWPLSPAEVRLLHESQRTSSTKSASILTSVSNIGKYSNELDDGNGTFKRLIAYPNPTRNDLIIEFEIESDEKISIEVFDMLGQPQYKTEHALHSGYQQVTLNDLKSKGLRSGTYLIKLTSNKDVRTRSFILSD